MLEQIVRQYLSFFPQEALGLKLLLKQVAEDQELWSKRNYEGHVTGSGVVLSPDHSKVLLIYHPSFGRWQQPGGHWEPEEKGPWLTARRETEEETGVKLKRIIFLKDNFVPIQIGSHPVPTVPPKNEPHHYHHDFRYGFVADSEDLNLEDEVIDQARWVPLDEVEEPIKTAAARLLQLLKG